MDDMTAAPKAASTNSEDTVALFVTNPLALRDNGAKDRMIAKAAGMTTKQVQKLKRSNYDRYERMFKKAGGAKALRAYKAKGKKARKAIAAGAIAPRGAYFAGLKGRPQDRAGSSDYHAVVGQALKRGMSMREAHAHAKRALAMRPNPRYGWSLSGLAVRSNPSVAGLLDTATGAVASVPFIGDYVAPVVAPVLIGAAMAGAHYLAVKYAVEPLLNMDFVPEKVRVYVEPVTYTATGVTVAAATSLIPASILSRQDKGIIAAGAVTVGAAFDLIRFLQARFGSDMVPTQMAADGSVEGLALQGLGYEGLGYQGLGVSDSMAGIYADADMGDAMYCGDDFDRAEGSAIIAGPQAWFARFGTPGTRRGAASKNGRSRHAGLHGHRWGWLIKCVGYDNARAIAAMSPGPRLKAIRQIKAQALAAAQEAVHGSLPSEDLAGTFGGARGADGAQGYGALIFAGESA